MRRIWGDVRPNETDEDEPAIPLFLVVEFATAILEFTDHGRERLAQCGILAIRPVNAPLMSLGIVDAQGQTLDVKVPAVGFEFL